ncbi:MAG: hypothetical protein WD078_10450 [Woeseia sp.]
MFQGFGGKSSATARAALTINGQRAALVRVSDGTAARPVLEARVFDVITGDSGEPDFTKSGVDIKALQNLPVSTVLPGGSYQLMLEELPNAPRDELKQALAWRIRDRIDTPLDEAIIELLDMPAQARGGQKPSAYAAVTSQAVVESLVAQVKRAGLKPDAIDLPELCLRNIAVRLPQDSRGVAFLHFTDDCGLLTITRGGVLYLVRRIDVGQVALDETPGTQSREALIPKICLELQRSLDYYETHYDCRPVSDLVLGPGSGIGALQEALRDQLGLDVTTLDLADLFDISEPLSEETQHECLLAIGAALRSEAPVRKAA